MQNYRQGNKIKHRIISTRTKWSEDLISDFEKLLKDYELEPLMIIKYITDRIKELGYTRCAIGNLDKI